MNEAKYCYFNQNILDVYDIHNYTFEQNIYATHVYNKIDMTIKLISEFKKSQELIINLPE